MATRHAHDQRIHLGFAVWDDGHLVRSLSLSPGHGIQENIGDPYDFELPYWAGEHAVDPVPGWPGQEPYPLPFHSLELGEEALRALFGFVVEGCPYPDDIDAEEVHLHGFRVTDPSGGEQAAREAMDEHWLDPGSQCKQDPLEFRPRMISQRDILVHR